MTQAGEYFLSRLQFGTHVLTAAGDAVSLLTWLAQHAKPFVDQKVLLGQKQHLSCRLIAWRVPEEQANRRRQKLRKEIDSRYSKAPHAERLAWCDWTILVTNVPDDLLTPPEAVVLYRARWQVENCHADYRSSASLYIEGVAA